MREGNGFVEIAAIVRGVVVCSFIVVDAKHQAFGESLHFAQRTGLMLQSMCDSLCDHEATIDLSLC